jgi:uncharacterized protein
VQDLTVSVADIVGRPGEHREFDLRADLGEVGNALARLQGSPVRARLRAESVMEGILVTGTVTGAARLQCARCLTGRPGEVAVEVRDLFAGPGAEGGDEDAYRLSGTDLDLEPLVRDAVVLALPLNPLCREDCQGLCAGCGADLNRGACTCAEDGLDPRWAALAGLQDRLTS